MRQQEDGTVSVWTGHFASQVEFADYIRWTHTDAGSASAFGSDAGLGPFDFGEAEAAFYEAVPVPAQRAIREFPAGHVFADVVEAALKAKAVEGWNCVLLLYDCSYSPARSHPSTACKLNYVGAFEYGPSG